ncbi:hypothetical protein [Undibacterium sp. SXout20W]|uniref:hypothetical protein n=1 Tax=Undibacterium sp. SXout20W TaxID=3413051 RepID=UPI003BF2DAA8
MNFNHLKHLFVKVHETTTEQHKSIKKRAFIMLARLLVGVAILRDQKLASIVRSIWSTAK